MSSSYCPFLFAQIKLIRKNKAKTKLTTNIMYITPMAQRNLFYKNVKMTAINKKYDISHN